MNTKCLCIPRADLLLPWSITKEEPGPRLLSLRDNAWIERKMHNYFMFPL